MVRAALILAGIDPSRFAPWQLFLLQFELDCWSGSQTTESGGPGTHMPAWDLLVREQQH